MTRIVLRGGQVIDPSTGRDEIADVAVGPMAAAAGGFTTVCAMPAATPVHDNRAITEMMVAKGKSHGLVHLRDAGCVAKAASRELLPTLAGAGTTGHGFSVNPRESVPTTAPRWSSYWPHALVFEPPVHRRRPGRARCLRHHKLPSDSGDLTGPRSVCHAPDQHHRIADDRGARGAEFSPRNRSRERSRFRCSEHLTGRPIAMLLHGVLE